MIKQSTLADTFVLKPPVIKYCSLCISFNLEEKRMSSQIIPVLIVGAGPTGLTFSNLLAQFEIPHRIIEQNLEPIKTSNALAVQPRTLEVWNNIGIADTGIREGKKILGMSLSNKKKQILKIHYANMNLPTSYPYILGLPQAETERILIENLQKKNLNIERGTKLFNLQTNNNGVIAEVVHSNGARETIHTEWLIAADGGHSTVREKMKIEFQGATIPEKFIMMDAKLTVDYDTDYFQGVLSENGTLLLITLKDFTRIICTVTNDKTIRDFKNPTIDDFERIIKSRTHLSLKIEKALWISHFVTHHRMINKFCYNRIFFTGDSAHIHSPAGGQGMNTGIQDSFNLAWKLAFVIKKNSNSKILNSYNIERKPVVENVLASTTTLTKMIGFKNPLLISIRNFLLSMIKHFKMIQKNIVMNLTDLAITYPKNLFIINTGKRPLESTLMDTKHNRVKLYQLLTGSKHFLLLFTGKNNEKLSKIVEMTQWIDHNHRDFFKIIIISFNNNDFKEKSYLDEHFHTHKNFKLSNGGICIIRPDQYIALVDKTISVDSIQSYLLNFNIDLLKWHPDKQKCSPF